MHKTIKTFLCIIFLSTMDSKPAFSDSPSKIAVVDFKKLWTSLSAIENLKQDLELMLKKYHQEFATIEASLRKENEDLLTLANKAPKEKSEISSLDKRRDSFEKKVFGIQKKAEKAQKSVNKSHGDAIDKIKKIIDDVIQKTAKDQKIDLVIDSRYILYRSPLLDMTKHVTEKVEAETQKIRLKIENING